MKEKTKKSHQEHIAISIEIFNAIEHQRKLMTKKYPEFVNPRTGKTKCVEDKILPKIRTHLDKFGKEFTACSMENTSSSSFKSLLEQMLDHVVSNTNLEDEE